MDECEFESLPIPITQLRDSLGFFYQHVAETNRPLVIQRYRDQSVVMVPLWEWRWLKRIEAKLHHCDPAFIEELLSESEECH